MRLIYITVYAVAAGAKQGIIFFLRNHLKQLSVGKLTDLAVDYKI